MNTNNILVIGDLHAPFIKEGYLEFCKAIYKKYKCNEVVFTGDILDNHSISMHDSNPDGYSSGEELDRAIEAIKPWVKTFKKARVCIGNHDELPKRHSVKNGVTSRWTKDFKEVLSCPGWDFKLQHKIDGVIYEHGLGSAPHIKMLRNRSSYVCGHNHSKLSTTFSVSDHDILFAMQIGWGGEQESYSMEYAKNFPRGIVSCGVVLNNGTLPIAIPMPLL